MSNQLKPFIQIGPGDIIRRNLEALGWKQDELADILGMESNVISEIINHKRTVTIETARLLGRVFKTSPQFWLNLDNKYRLAEKPKKVKENQLNTTGIKAQIRRYMPYLDMIKKGWVKKPKKAADLQAAYKEFWQVKKMDFSFYENQTAAFHARKSADDPEFTKNYSTTWLQMAHRVAGGLAKTNHKFQLEKVKEIALSIPKYTLQANGIKNFIEDLQNAGVTFFVLSHLPKTYLDGAAFQYKKEKYIVYTSRQNRIDNFWFTMAHELAHIVLHVHSEKDTFLDNLDEKANTQKEEEADKQAARWLLIEQVIGLARLQSTLNKTRLQMIADETGLALAVVVGILQFNGMLTYRSRMLSEVKTPVDKWIPNKYKKG